jgi:hypothetical protein
MKKNISLIDAPVEGDEGQEHFVGINLTTKNPAEDIRDDST